MPMHYEGSTIRPGSRSHSRLVTSPGDSPAGDWIIDQNLPGLFAYHYGGWTLDGTKVVIPKGSVLTVGAHQKDYRTLKRKNVLTFAGGTSGSKIGTYAGAAPIGVAPYNYYRRYDAQGNIKHGFSQADDFIPGIITRDYIELPYLPNPQDVYTWDTSSAHVLGDATEVTGMKFYWGCVTNTATDFVDSSKILKAGDYVRSGPFGKLVKWNPNADDPQLIVGQVYELLTDVPPEGWLEWVQSGEETDPVRKDTENPVAPGINDENYGFQADYMWPADRYDLDSPIPGMHDGAQMQIRRANFTVTVDGEGDGTATIQLDPILKADEDSIIVKIDGIPEDDFEVSLNATTQVLTVTVDTGESADTYNGSVEYLVATDTRGVIPSWDYAGSVGAVRILLKL